MQATREVSPPVGELVQDALYPVAKRLLDATVALLLLIGLAPLLLLCALAVWLSSPGPALFRQQRIGEGGRPFTMLKFRSMVVNADASQHRAYASAFIQGTAARERTADGEVYKLVRDPRITPVGRVLRATSLDELPQLWNVLRGEMSLVGPRPPIAYEVESYQPRHLQRLGTKPGITGLWQVSGWSKTTFEEMVELDIEYIRRRSVALDLWIIAKTIPVVIASRAAR
jgi:lipopolysaccharide/colanic/teichoic acid biosynthesis glycosyltransferase